VFTFYFAVVFIVLWLEKFVVKRLKQMERIVTGSVYSKIRWQ